MIKIVNVIAFALALTFGTFTVFGRNEFYPDWSNCNPDSQLDFIDFYFDHKPSTKHAINTLTFCTGKGKELPIGIVHVQIEDSTSKKLMNETYPSLFGFRFINGIYDRCLQAGALELTQPVMGDYNLTMIIYAKHEKLMQLGCLHANWTIHPRDDLIEIES